MRRVDSDGGSNGGARGTSGTLHPVPMNMDQISDNVKYVATGEGGEVPDGLYSGFQSPDIS